MDDSTTANQARIIKEFIAGYEGWTAEGVTRHRHKDCIHIQLPKSMGVPQRTNDEYRKYFNKVLAKPITGFKTQSRILVNDARDNIAVFAVTATSQSAIGPYEDEYIWALWFTKDGSEIVRIEETVDSKRTADFFARLQLAAKTGLTVKL
ncbi:hypothetical protein M409DRAFT_49120 [Zasmidium cellare ATCC 36951]|uniref:SnoaL-like domain-containing protein n=1 Tax=Zasmidium cellare ATCC 36951 TaxID=1080233 RepID=A0A6A6D7P4_ZASCE|nr:uncharacterized protein M409DRAFT_49120 [Zasmidium cellare ATCC 36951]KAF2174262.1 hypothetical protein M409DRAFT_49120 [Zasmidium cellare ATCC 36951]